MIRPIERKLDTATVGAALGILYDHIAMTIKDDSVSNSPKIPGGLWEVGGAMSGRERQRLIAVTEDLEEMLVRWGFENGEDG